MYSRGFFRMGVDNGDMGFSFVVMCCVYWCNEECVIEGLIEGGGGVGNDRDWGII